MTATLVDASLPAHPAVVAQARQHVRQALLAHALSDVLEDAVLIVSELVTNAVMHARGRVTLAVRYAKPVLRIEVSDEGSGAAQVEQRGPTALGGRGLPLVAAMADRWGTVLRPDGKTVWAELGEPAGRR